MNETPQSDLKIFTTSDYDELLAGVGEMTGLADAEVQEILQRLPKIDGLVTVRNICALEPEKAKQNSLYLEFDYPDGKMFTFGKTLTGDIFFGEASSRYQETIEVSMRFEPAKAASGSKEADTKDVDEGWVK